MIKYFTFLFICFSCFSGMAQTTTDYNLDFQQVNTKTGLPQGWWQCNNKDDEMKEKNTRSAFRLDSNTKHNNKYSMLIDWTDGNAQWTGAGCIISRHFKGKSIKLTGYAKTEAIAEWAGLWMRIDGADNAVLAFDNMQSKPITGTTGWKEYSITLDYDQEKAKRIALGGIIQGKGKMWLNDLHVTIDGTDITTADTINEVTLDTLSITAPAGAPLYRASATRVWDIKNTRIALSFNWNEKTADVKEWITLHPYFYPSGTVELDAKGMRIDSVLLMGRKGNTPINYSYANDKLVLTLGKEYPVNDTLQVYIKYTAMPYGSPTGGSGAITDDRGLYFINTDHKVPHKPAMIWTQGETEANSHWMVTIDKPNTRTNHTNRAHRAR